MIWASVHKPLNILFVSWAPEVGLKLRKNNVENCRLTPQNSRLPTWYGHFGKVQSALYPYATFILCSKILPILHVTNPGHLLVSLYSQNLICGTRVGMHFQSYQCNFSNSYFLVISAKINQKCISYYMSGSTLTLLLFTSMETGDRSRCDPETLCIQTYHVIC